MKEFLYYRCVDGYVGIKTNIKNFNWPYGICRKPVDKNEYEKCKIKVALNAVDDKNVFDCVDTENYKTSFRHFKASENKKSVIFDQTIAKFIRLRYLVTVSGNTVNAVFGKSYIKTVKIKTMYIHPVRFILFDLVTLMLLKNGLLTVYCSAVKLSGGKTAVMLSPPNAGKSLTALNLLNKYNAKIIAEDMAVTDGEFIYGVPNTESFRNYNNEISKDISSEDMVPSGKIDYLFFMQKGSDEQLKPIDKYFEKLKMISRYAVGYYYSPFLRVLDWFNDDFSVTSAEKTEDDIIEKIQASVPGYLIERKNPMEFADIIISTVQ